MLGPLLAGPVKEFPQHARREKWGSARLLLGRRRQLPGRKAPPVARCHGVATVQRRGGLRTPFEGHGKRISPENASNEGDDGRNSSDTVALGAASGRVGEVTPMCGARKGGCSARRCGVALATTRRPRRWLRAGAAWPWRRLDGLDGRWVGARREWWLGSRSAGAGARRGGMWIRR
jgi:hypothetical protein